MHSFAVDKDLRRVDIISYN